MGRKQETHESLRAFSHHTGRCDSRWQAFSKPCERHVIQTKHFIRTIMQDNTNEGRQRGKQPRPQRSRFFSSSSTPLNKSGGVRIGYDSDTADARPTITGDPSSRTSLDMCAPPHILQMCGAGPLGQSHPFSRPWLPRQGKEDAVMSIIDPHGRHTTRGSGNHQV